MKATEINIKLALKPGASMKIKAMPDAVNKLEGIMDYEELGG